MRRSRSAAGKYNGSESLVGVSDAIPVRGVLVEVEVMDLGGVCMPVALPALFTAFAAAFISAAAAAASAPVVTLARLKLRWRDGTAEEARGLLGCAAGSIL